MSKTTVTNIINQIIALDPTLKAKQGILYHTKKTKLKKLRRQLKKEVLANERIQNRSGANVR